MKRLIPFLLFLGVCLRGCEPVACRASSPATNANVYVAWEDITSVPLAGAVTTAKPLASSFNGTNAVALNSRKATNDVNGVAWFSNLVVGNYLISVATTEIVSPFTIQVTNSGTYNAIDLPAALTNTPSGQVAYTQAQSDARYVKVPPTGTPYAWVPSSTTDPTAPYVWAQQTGTNASGGGSGTITNVIAGAGLAGGGTNGAVTLTTNGAPVAAAINFTGSVGGDVTGLQGSTVVQSIDGGVLDVTSIEDSVAATQGATAAATPSTLVERDANTNALFGAIGVTGETNASLTALRAVASGVNKDIVSSSTTFTELSFVHGVTGAIQTNLDARQVGAAALTNLAAGNGSALTNLQGNSGSYAAITAHDNTTNYWLNFSGVQNQDVATTNNVAFTATINGPGGISISMDENGTTGRSVLIPDTMVPLNTNGATHTGTNYVWTIPTGSNRVWISFSAKTANPSFASVTYSFNVGPGGSGGGGTGVTSVTGDGNFTSGTITGSGTLSTVAAPNGSGITNLTPANFGAGQIPLANLTNLSGPYRTVYIPAGAMDAMPTNGATTGAATAATNSASTNLNRDAWTMSVAATNGLHFTWASPPYWDGSALKMELIVTCIGTNASTATNYVWSVAALDSGNNSTLTAALGTAQQMTSGIYTTSQLISKATSTAVTVGGSPAAGDYVDFAIKTLGGNASWTVTNTNFQVLGAIIQYLETTNKPTTL